MSSSENFIDQKNAELAARIQQTARQAREYILELSGVMLIELLTRDAKAIEETPEGELRKSWVTEDEDSAPRAEPGSPHRCLTFMIEYGVAYREGRERLRFLIPKPEGFEPDNPEHIAEMETPGAVFIERSSTTPDGRKATEIGRYAVFQDVSYPYSLDEQRAAILDQQNFRAFAGQRVPHELNRLGRILEDMTNGDTRPQRSTFQGDGPVVDL